MTPLLRGIFPAMTPNDLRKLRSDLRCTARELATTLGIELRVVQDWESGERFPTKAMVARLQQLGDAGPASIQRKPARATQRLVGLDRLSDPRLWALIRRLTEHPVFFEQVLQLAEKYDDSSDRPAANR